jgi:CrcB protein
MFKNLVIVGIGGFIGTAARFVAYQLFKSSAAFWTTLSVNILGCLLIGIFTGIAAKSGLNQYEKLFLTTGVCGGFTTFSAFSIENVKLMQEGKYLLAASYITLSIIAGIASAFLGYKLAN